MRIVSVGFVFTVLAVCQPSVSVAESPQATVNVSRAQPAAPTAGAASPTVDHASLIPERGVLTIHGTGLGPDVVVTMGDETLPLLAGASSEQVEALAPPRVLTKPGTYRISVVDQVRGTETAFVVVSQPASSSAATDAIGGDSSSEAAREPATTVGPRPAKSADATAGDAGADGNGPSPQLIEDATLQNTAVGVFALDQDVFGDSNTAAGYSALRYNTIGRLNVASGAFALWRNTTGNENTATGAWASSSNTTGFENTADGFGALQRNTTGFQNVAAGALALFDNTTGSSNTAVGYQALRNNTADANLAIGRDALLSNTTGFYNSASGAYSLSTNTTGTRNTAHGYAALFRNANGDANVATGSAALYSNSTGRRNAAVGDQALYGNVSGDDNTAVGYQAGTATTGSHNIYLGANALGTATDANTMRLGVPFNGASGTGQNKTFIAGIYGTQLTSPAQQIFVDVNGQIGILGPPVVSQPISGTLNAAPRDQVLEARLEALDELVQQQQATIAEQAAAAKAQATALAALQSRVDGLVAGARRRQ